MGHGFPTHFPGAAPPREDFHPFLKVFFPESPLLAPCLLSPAGRALLSFKDPKTFRHPPPTLSKNKPTYHMIMITNFITISFKMLKNSTISLACSPIFPMAMPKAMKNPIRPVEWITSRRRTSYKVCVSSPSFTIPDTGSHLLTCPLPRKWGIRVHTENTFPLDNYGIP